MLYVVFFPDNILRCDGKENKEAIGMILMSARLVKILLVLIALFGAAWLAQGAWRKNSWLDTRF